MSPKIPIGIDSFRKLRLEGFTYVDKSFFVREVIENSAAVVLLPRPRRFGKTLNLSMLRCFFDRAGGDARALFDGLQLARDDERVWRHANRYPVISLTFKAARSATWDTTFSLIRQRLVELFEEHREVLDGGRLTPSEEAHYRRVLDGSASTADYALALRHLSKALHLHHGEEVVVLIDEYDAPLHAGHLGGYLGEALDFFRIFLGEALKENHHLRKGVVSGILRIARENIFSGLNNLDVCTLLNERFRDAFGFTEGEVVRLLGDTGHGESLEVVRAWYNGYLFGGEVIYNPWSVLNFIHNGGRPAPYWLNTSSNDLVRDLLQRHASAVQADIEVLLRGNAIERRPDDNVILTSLESDPAALWSLLLFSGYLKAAPLLTPPLEQTSYALSIPNLEVREVYTTTFADWMRRALHNRGGSLEGLLTALLEGDAPRLEAQLTAFTLEMLSYHDIGGPRPERVYQAFMIGLVSALLPDIEVRSNREAGKGRADMLIRPRRSGRPGVVLELKVARSRAALGRALADGMNQIREKGYAGELISAGVSPVRCVVVAFDGKELRVRSTDADVLLAEPRKPPARRASSKKAPRAKTATRAKNGAG